MEFKAGDIVQIKSLEEVEEKGEHYFKFGFVEEMRIYCGDVYKIQEIDARGRVYFEDAPIGVQSWSWSESMLDPYAQPSEPNESEVMCLF